MPPVAVLGRLAKHSARTNQSHAYSSEHARSFKTITNNHPEPDRDMAFSKVAFVPCYLFRGMNRACMLFVTKASHNPWPLWPAKSGSFYGRTHEKGFTPSGMANHEIRPRGKRGERVGLWWLMDVSNRREPCILPKMGLKEDLSAETTRMRASLGPTDVSVLS